MASSEYSLQAEGIAIPKIQPEGCTLNSLPFAPPPDKSLVASAREFIIHNV